MAIERVIDNISHEEDQEEQAVEVSLRPTNFAEYIGQERLKKNLKIAIAAVKKRNDGTTLDHVLLYGPPGLGKTTMANVIAHELGSNLRVTSGPAIERAGDLASILTNLQNGDVLFIDEIHRLRREYYNESEIGQIIARTANILGTEISEEATATLAARSRLTPRIANRLMKRVRDFADVHGDGSVDLDIATQALGLMEIDSLGLDPADRNMLKLMLDNYGNRPVGLTTIAALTGDEATTIEDYYEPFLIQLGFIEKTPRGRIVTEKAKRHLASL